MDKARRNRFIEQPEDIADAFTPLTKSSKKRSLKEKLDSILSRLSKEDCDD